MEHKSKNKSALVLIVASPILYVILGICLLLLPALAIQYLPLALSVVTAITGIVEICGYLARPTAENFQSNGFAMGLAVLLLAIAIQLQKDWFMEQMFLILGLLIALNGIKELQNWIDAIRLKITGGWAAFFVALLNLAVGIAVMLGPSQITDAYTILSGVGLLISGLTDNITTAVILVKRRKYSTSPENVELPDAAAPENL